MGKVSITETEHHKNTEEISVCTSIDQAETEIVNTSEVLAIKPPSWAQIAEKPGLSVEEDPVLPTPEAVVPLKSPKVSTIVVAVDVENQNSNLIEKDADGFITVKAKRDSQIYHEIKEDIEQEKDAIDKEENAQSKAAEIETENKSGDTSI